LGWNAISGGGEFFGSKEFHSRRELLVESSAGWEEDTVLVVEQEACGMPHSGSGATVDPKRRPDQSPALDF
jgi:hypothetical protein